MCCVEMNCEFDCCEIEIDIKLCEICVYEELLGLFDY